MGKKVPNLIGKTFGFLTVIRKSEHTNKYRRTFWVCKCICGKEHTVVHGNLMSGSTKSCGCKTKELHNQKIVKHGMSYTVEYTAWWMMQSRCYNKKDIGYKHYGAKGITVHEEWRGPGGFEKWFNHIGPRPGAYYSQDRVDNTKGYEPGNVKWSTTLEQNRNHGRVKLSAEKAKEIRRLYATGITQKELGNLYNVCFQTISDIIRNKIWKVS